MAMQQLLTRIDATIEATQATAWPHFAGGTLRGAFGRALRRAACVTGKNHCEGCPLRANCAYGAVFDPPPPARPLHPSFNNGLPAYVIQPPALGACQLDTGQTQHFSLLLFPHVKDHHQLIAHELRNAVVRELMRPGLFELRGIQTTAMPVTGPEPLSPCGAQDKDVTLTLRWHTPLRLQQNGKPLFKADQLDAIALVRSLLRRQLQWWQLTGTPQDIDLHTHNANAVRAATLCNLSTSNMRWHDIQRHSSTQNEKLPLGGLIGSASLRGPSQAMHLLNPLLQLGQSIHLGKETMVGLGRFDLGSAPA